VSSFVLFFLVGVKLRYLVPVGLVGIVVVVLAIRYVPHARDRWQDFLSGSRYHQEQSLIGIGSGGPVGTGLGEGKQKFFFLPKLHNDFIFAGIGEEFGFIGSLFIYLLYGLLFVRGMRISREAINPFSQYLAGGISVLIFLYALVHVAVTLGLIPTTGQPLPFVSYGGTALVTNLLAAGILLNISRYRQQRSRVREPMQGWSSQQARVRR
jgi:cell division protein FtsW